MPLLLRQSAGGKENGPDDHVNDDFLNPIRSRSEDISHDDAVKSTCHTRESKEPNKEFFHPVPSPHNLIFVHKQKPRLIPEGKQRQMPSECSPLIRMDGNGVDFYMPKAFVANLTSSGSYLSSFTNPS